jgi:hypothetical protein
MTNSKIKLNLDSLQSRREWKRHKVKDGHNVFRILPPFGEASNGYPYRKYQLIWGLLDPATGRARPFASSMGTEKKCPVTEFVQDLKKKAEATKASMQASGTSEEEIREALKGINEVISNLSPKTIYIYNAADKSGEVGLLELKSTAHKKMKQEMNQYVHDYNQDPTSLNSQPDDSGVWFDIVRQGSFRDTTYDVKKCQLRVKDPASGRMNYQDDQTPLPDSVVENYSNLGYDLTAVYQIKTYDELQDILEANMERLSDLIGVQTAPSPAPKTAPSASKATQPSSKAPQTKVTTKFNDADDDEEDDVPVVAHKTSKGKVALQDDDDFFSQADAILNG